MSQPSRDQYLESKVFTASQPKLHMMLLDGAVRFGTQAKEMWAVGTEFVEIEKPLSRMTDIVEELVHGLAAGKGEANVSKQLEEQYAFVYRELISCRINESLESLESCLKVLSFQRETWKQATEQSEGETVVPAPKMSTPKTAAPRMATPKMAMPNLTVGTTQATSGFSFEA